MLKRSAMTWEEQRDEIQRLNAKALKYASDLIDGTKVEQKGIDREGNPIFTEVSDGIDMLARCSTIAKQWMSEQRQAGSVQATSEPSDHDLKTKSRTVRPL